MAAPVLTQRWALPIYWERRAADSQIVEEVQTRLLDVFYRNTEHTFSSLNVTKTFL